MALGFKPDKIVNFIVDRPGFARWSTHKSENAAKKELARQTGKIAGYQVYAIHESGKKTGPY